MNKLDYTPEQLETAFEFLRIAIKREGYVYDGVEVHGLLPLFGGILIRPERYTHLPELPKKEKQCG